MSAPMTPEQVRAEVTAEFVAWLVKKAREHRARGPQYAKQADVIGMLASKVSRGAVRPNNLLMLPAQGGPEDAVLAAQARRPRRFTPLEEAVQGIETAIAPLTGDQRAGADMVLAYLRTLTTPVPTVRVSPWDRAVAGLNALVDANIAFWIEPDGHISGPFGDEHIEWDHDTSRWRLVHDDEDDVHPRHPSPCRVPDSPNCTCPTPAARDLRPGAETARRMIADRQTAEDPHDSPLHRTYETSHDLPEVGGYRSAPLPAAAALCATCGHNGAAHHHAGTACWADIPKRLGEAIRLCKCSAFVEVTR
ncbi:hypothetical protein [[Kitasatospora] papulosa]|uniref:hypothetical protein n=1 Tax=[Kitasatospora] papulosa TaxID=1464011 RepID=UPI0036355124